MENCKTTDMDQYFIDLSKLIRSDRHPQDDDKQYFMVAVETDKQVYMLYQ